MSGRDFDTDNFKIWLKNNTNLSSRSINDVVSRANRLITLMDPVKPKSDAELDYLIEDQPELRDRSQSIRSQLKRAARLYRSYVKNLRKG